MSIPSRASYREGRLQHREEAETFYRELAAQGVRVRVGMEASGQARWVFSEVQKDLDDILSEIKGTR